MTGTNKELNIRDLTLESETMAGRLTQITPLILALFLASCSGTNYALDNYTGVDVKSFVVEPEPGAVRLGRNGEEARRGQAYRIFDKPDENRLMITPDLGAAFGQGFFGARQSEVVYRDAAAKYLASTGRQCEIVDSVLIMDPQYEIKYRCADGGVAAAPG